MESLPPELLTQILAHPILTPSDLQTIRLVSHYLSQISTPILFQTIHLYPLIENLTWLLDTLSPSSSNHPPNHQINHQINHHDGMESKGNGNGNGKGKTKIPIPIRPHIRTLKFHRVAFPAYLSVKGWEAWLGRSSLPGPFPSRARAGEVARGVYRCFGASQGGGSGYSDSEVSFSNLCLQRRWRKEGEEVRRGVWQGVSSSETSSAAPSAAAAAESAESLAKEGSSNVRMGGTEQRSVKSEEDRFWTLLMRMSRETLPGLTRIEFPEVDLDPYMHPVRNRQPWQIIRSVVEDEVEWQTRAALHSWSVSGLLSTTTTSGGLLVEALVLETVFWKFLRGVETLHLGRVYECLTGLKDLTIRLQNAGSIEGTSITLGAWVRDPPVHQEQQHQGEAGEADHAQQPQQQQHIHQRLEDTRVGKKVSGLINAPKDLRSLDIGFWNACTPEDGLFDLHEVFVGSPGPGRTAGEWSNLKTLRLAGMNVSGEALIALLRRHKNSLRDLGFRDVRLKGGGGTKTKTDASSWITVFKSIREELLELTNVSFEGGLLHGVNDGWEVWSSSSGIQDATIKAKMESYLLRRGDCPFSLPVDVDFDLLAEEERLALFMNFPQDSSWKYTDDFYGWNVRTW